MNQTIVSCIRQSHLISFIYDSHPRIVEPHAYGISKEGHELLRCYQVAGSGVTCQGVGWHHMTVSKMIGITDTGNSFSGTKPKYNRDDPSMSTIFARL
jgi:hypothetical protein